MKECVPVISSVSQDGEVEIKFPYKLKVAETLNTLERKEYLRNLTANIEFEIRVKQPSQSEDQGITPEDYKEPKVFSWNVTYADFQVIRVQLSFNNTLYISAKDDKVSFSYHKRFRT